MALNIGQLGLDAIGRMGGHGYARTRDYFDLPTRSLQAWPEALGVVSGFGRPRNTPTEKLITPVGASLLAKAVYQTNNL